MPKFSDAPLQPETCAGLDFNEVPEQGKPRNAARSPSPDEVITAFRADALARGVNIPAEIVLGQLMRCDTTGRNGEEDASYILHVDGYPNGGFQNWQTGGWMKWRWQGELPRVSRTEMRKAAKANLEAKRKRDEHFAELRAKAEVVVALFWEKNTVDDPAGCGYLVRKQVQSYGVRRHKSCDATVVPMHDEHGALRNTQTILADGKKDFIQYARLVGLRYVIGDPKSCGGILIGEGFATVASALEAAGSTCTAVVAFTKDNLLAVAMSIRSQHPDKPILLVADNDADKPGNPGVAKARAAAEAVNGWIVIPDLPTHLNLPPGGDFNDVHCRLGIDEVKRQLRQAQRVGVPQILPPDPATPQRLADPAMATSLVTATATQTDIESAIRRVLFANFGEIDRSRALESICASARVPKKAFNSTVKRMQRECRDEIAARAPKPWLGKLYVKGDEIDPHPTMANACIVFRDAPGWGGVLWDNEFTGMTHVRRCPPYEDAQAGQPCDRAWTDADEAATTEWMQTFGGIPTIEGWRIFTAVQRIAHENKFHPVRDYLDALRFDQRELDEVHFDDFLTYYCGVEDNLYPRAIGSRFLISAVARIYWPGCKVDCSLILEGPQGLKKSTAFEILASKPWFTDASEEIGSKDAALQRRGKWFWEHAELDNLNRGEVGRIKADMSRTVDRFRPPYGRNMIEQPRQNVHCGTVNDRQYLRDPTGARRFWPAKCGERIDTDALTADRDKLWAVAVQRYRQKARWYLDDPVLVEMAKVEQDARYVEDAWEPLIAGWLDANARRSVTVADLLEHALGIFDKSKWTKEQQGRVTGCLKHLGWEYKNARLGFGRGSKVAKRWVRPDDDGVLPVLPNLGEEG
jgi:predicted P-loop ATPase/phage/plasmid primase-like uncharacterized protein